MSSFSSLNTALSGLQSHKRAIDLIGHNIANVNTAGYSRRQVQLQPSVGLAVASRYNTDFNWNNLGVSIEAVNRIRDSFLDVKARNEIANSASATTLDSILGSIEGVFPEPSDTALAGQLSAFWNSFADAANSPGSLPARTAVLAQATSLVSAFAKSAADLTTMHQDLSAQLSMNVEEVNSLAKQVADLNSQIRAAGVAGADIGDLEDQRDLLIDQLTTSVGATTRPNEYGQIDVMLGGSALVSGGRSERIQVASSGSLPPPLNTLPLVGTELQWERDGYPVNSFGGTIGGIIQGVNDVVPRYMADLNTSAAALVGAVNGLHTTGQGQDTVNDVGLNFFDPAGVTASTLAISADVDGQPTRIALATLGAGGLDSAIGHALGTLGASTTGPDATHRSMLGRLGVEAQTAASRATLQQRFAIEAENQRTAVSGVNLDEEMTNLVMSQRAYESSARLLTTIDQMLDQLINRTGVVGR